VTRRTEILATAAQLFATSGFQVNLADIADACGIKAGSLYHHFESKEAIIVELIERFQIELDGVASWALENLRQNRNASTFELVVIFSESILGCASRHRAALLQTFYEPPAAASEKFVQLASLTSLAIEKTMLEILRGGHKAGYIRPEVDLSRLAENICESMLRTGVGALHNSSDADLVPRLNCRMLFEGLVVKPPSNDKLSKSKAFAAAESAIATWQHSDKNKGTKSAEFWAAARREFGRRGYEGTTIRDIAAAAGVSIGAAYRIVSSKDEILEVIMRRYIRHVVEGWHRVLESKSDAVEKLDALLWLDVNVLSQFNDEHKIQLAWLRESPPSSTNFSEFADIVNQTTSLLKEGEKSGAFRNFDASITMRTSSLLELIWLPEKIVRGAGTTAAFAHSRNTLMRGAQNR
jgi:AcrR family transcriptional regulator